jgi:putative transposase
MSQSLSKVYVHITFSTKNHQPFIDDTIKASIFEYIGGICKGLDNNPVRIGGHHDHVHILCLLSRQITFKDEFRAFLEKYKVDYDERYVWD